MFDKITEEVQKQGTGAMFEKFKPQLRAMATIVAERERAQLELAQRLAEASDAEVAVEEIPDVEERAAELEAMAEAASQTDLEGWYFESFAPDHLDNPERAAQYAGAPSDQWEARKAAWAAEYRAAAPEAESYSEGDLAGLHVENTFGVPLEEFEANVVAWRPGEAMKRVLTAHLTSVEGVMAAVAADLEGDALEDAGHQAADGLDAGAEDES